MMRWLLLLLVCGLMYGQDAPVAVTSDGLYCNAVRREVTKIQTYCYKYPMDPGGWVLLHNTIDTMAGNSSKLMVTFNYGTSPAFTWMFSYDNGTVTAIVAYGQQGLTKTAILP